MSLKFHTYFFMASLALLAAEICIAIMFTTGFIRHTFGDFLVVILMYCSIRSVVEAKPMFVALVVLVIAFGIEFLQLWNLLDYLNLRDHQLAAIILGSTFEITDLIAYTLGVACISIIDLKLKPHDHI